MPEVHRNLAGDQCCATAVAILDDLQQVVALLGGEWFEPSLTSPHSQMAPNMCANRGWAASIWVNRLMSGSRRKSVMFGMSS